MQPRVPTWACRVRADTSTLFGDRGGSSRGREYMLHWPWAWWTPMETNEETRRPRGLGKLGGGALVPGVRNSQVQT